jgi:hypothetical protein
MKNLLFATLLACACGLSTAVGGTHDTAAPAGASVAGSLRLADGHVLVLGTTDGAQGSHAALWRLRSDGTLDNSFAGTGLLIATGVPGSRGLSIQQSANGMFQIAVQAGPAVLEVHRWPAGMETPMRVTSQPVPEDWIGPPALTQQGTAWVWIDQSRPQAPALKLVPVTRDTPWTASTPAAPIAAVDPAPSQGGAIFIPFSAAAPAVRPGPTAPPPEAFNWTAPLVLALIIALGGALWWQRTKRHANSRAN